MRTTTLPPAQQSPAGSNRIARSSPTWPRMALMLGAGGVMGFGVAWLLERYVWAWLVVIATIVMVVGVVVDGVRSARRQDLMVLLVQALAPLLGTAEPTAIQARRWSSWWVGSPRRLVLEYAPGVPDDSAEWLAKVTETVERRLQVVTEVRGHNLRDCRLLLDNKVTEGPAAEVSPVELRARAVVRSALGAAAKVDVASDNEGLTQVSVTHSAGTKVASNAYRLRVERAVTTMLPGRWRANWQLEEDRVEFTRRPVLPTTVPHVPEPITKENLHKPQLALSEDGEVIRWDLKAGGPHLLVAGKTGKGKTVLINGAVMEACRRQWPVWVADPKQVEFMGLEEWPNVQIIATSVLEIIVMIKAAHDEMERRYTAIRARRAVEEDFEPLIVVVDEYRNLVRLVEAWWAYIRSTHKKVPTKCPFYDWWPAMAEKGRTAGVHLLKGTQRPDAAFLGEGMRDNFDTRLSLGPLSPQGAQMMWESPYLGVAVPRKIRGRGTARDSEERVEEIQVLWTPDPRRATSQADLDLLEALRPEEVSHGRLEVVLGDETDLDGVEQPLWTRVQEAQLVPAGQAYQPGRLSNAPTASTIDGSTPAVESEMPVTPEPEGDGFGSEETVNASQVQAGDLLLVDEALQWWALVEAAEPDLVEDDQICLDWRGDEDDAGSLSLDSDALVTIRHPLPEKEETDD